MDIERSIESAIQHYQSGNLIEVKDICAEIIKERPDHAEILYLLGITHAQLEENDLAVQYLEKSLHFNADHADAYLALGAIFHKRGILDEAVTYYLKTIEIDPDFAEAHENLGDIFRDSGQFDEAVACYKRAVECCPDAAEVYFSLGNIFLTKKQIDLATFYYQKALKYKPDFAEAYKNLGIIFDRQGRLDEAMGYYKKALYHKPDLYDAYINLVDASQEKRRLQEATNSYRSRLAFTVSLGFLKVEMMINAVINEFYFKRLNIQFHPDVLDGEHSFELKQQIMKKIFAEIQKIDNSDKFFTDLKRLAEIKEYFAEPHSEPSLQNEPSPIHVHKKVDQVSVIERLHREFKLMAADLETQLVEILHSPLG